MIPIFEDNHLLVLNKPPGLLTQPSGTEQNSLEQQAKEWLKTARNKPGNVFLEAVHRLDKPVSGIVIFGKTSKALSRLNASIREGKSKKIYWGWVEGEDMPDSDQLEHYLIHSNFHAEIVDKHHPEGKKAQLLYRTLERKNGRTLLEITLITGRYHQIRLQLATIGHPIWGDKKYGSIHGLEQEAIALHHSSLSLPHPISKEWLTFEAPINLKL